MDKDEYEALLKLSVNQFNSNASAKRGAAVSDETRAKMSAKGKGKVVSIETRKKIGDGHRGKVVTDETRDKLSKINKGKIIPKEVGLKIALANTGKKRTEETKIKQSENNGMNKKVLTPNGVYRSVTAAATAYGKHVDTIKNWIKKGDKGFSFLD